MPESATVSSLDLVSLARLYWEEGVSVSKVLSSILERIDAYSDPAVWTLVLPRSSVLSQAEAVERKKQAGESLRLYGVPFAIKDNIDVAGYPTTAGCPAYAYLPEKTAPVVACLQNAGAILIGKTNLDQFATGLAGDRTPYGTCRNVFDPAYIAGGSSSGSAVAVAAGLVSFALGTDTAGSGRVPAGCNNIVGLKPTPGLLSTEGVVPACRSLDCVSIFALNTGDALAISELAQAPWKEGPGVSDAGKTVTSPGIAPKDPQPARGPDRAEAALACGATGPGFKKGSGTFVRSTLRAVPAKVPDPFLNHAGFSFAVPEEDQLEFFGDDERAALFSQAVARLEKMGGRRCTFDFAPFRQVGDLLYGGPWLAERLAAIEDFFNHRQAEIHPVTRGIIARGAGFSAVDVFRALRRLESLAVVCNKVFDKASVLAVPTIPALPTIADVAADSAGWSQRLGYYTSFVNLLGLAAVALPSVFNGRGLPTGITLIGPGGSDRRLCELGLVWQRSLGLPCGATPWGLPEATRVTGETSEVSKTSEVSLRSAPPGHVRLAVAGAHLRGQPLHPDLLSSGARLVRTCRTAARYRFVALMDLKPPRPGLIRDEEQGGAATVEIYDLPMEGFGKLVASVAPPLAIGTIALEDGEAVKGFLCESYAASRARDITEFGGWVAFLVSRVA